MAVAFDDAAMITNDLRDQRQAEPGTVGLRRHEGIEQMREHVLRHSRPIIMHAELERQRHPVPRTRHLEADARTIGRGQNNLAALTLTDGFRGILQQIEKTCTSWSRLAKTGGSDGS